MTNEELTRAYFQAAQTRDFDRCRELFHPEYSYTGADGERKEGAEAGFAIIETMTTAFPDLKLDIQRLYQDGDTVVAEFIASGTHQGDLMGVPPTGRTMRLPACLALDIRDGQIQAEREYFDSGALMRQLGVGG